MRASLDAVWVLLYTPAFNNNNNNNNNNIDYYTNNPGVRVFCFGYPFGLLIRDRTNSSTWQSALYSGFLPKALVERFVSRNNDLKKKSKQKKIKKKSRPADPRPVRVPFPLRSRPHPISCAIPIKSGTKTAGCGASSTRFRKSDRRNI
ncbi:hypothetical protein LY76DRAFT_353073 [Colletotrichum caudatum]|nr:hypothetical protein LY76DRAFT_353073 [Colletotrichum caudatum]